MVYYDFKVFQLGQVWVQRTSFQYLLLAFSIAASMIFLISLPNAFISKSLTDTPPCVSILTRLGLRTVRQYASLLSQIIEHIFQLYSRNILAIKSTRFEALNDVRVRVLYLDLVSNVPDVDTHETMGMFQWEHRSATGAVSPLQRGPKKPATFSR